MNTDQTTWQNHLISNPKASSGISIMNIVTVIVLWTKEKSGQAEGLNEHCYLECIYMAIHHNTQCKIKRGFVICLLSLISW